jgi:hypothetical protein
MGDVAMANARRYVRRCLQPLSELEWDAGAQSPRVMQTADTR